MSIESLKSEIFDLIKQQDILRLRYRQVEEAKQKKLQELEKEEKDVQDRAKEETPKS